MFMITNLRRRWRAWYWPGARYATPAALTPTQLALIAQVAHDRYLAWLGYRWDHPARDPRSPHYSPPEPKC